MLEFGASPSCIVGTSSPINACMNTKGENSNKESEAVY